MSKFYKNRKLVIKISYPNIFRRKNLVIIFITYIIICALYYFLFLSSQWTNTKAFLDKVEPGFATSLSASILDDLIIFFTLTLVVTILTTKDLLDEKFENKIRAIINSEQAKDNNTIQAFLHKNVSKLIIYDKLLEFHISIMNYSERDVAYKLYIEYKFHTVNMCKDREFEDQKFNFYVSNLILPLTVSGGSLH